MSDSKHCSKCNSKCRCPKNDHKSVQALTTGPFRVPMLSNSNRPVNLLVIGLKNPTNKQKTVTVTLDRCPQAVFPVTSEETTTFRRVVTLDPHECTQIQIPSGVNFSPLDLLR